MNLLRIAAWIFIVVFLASCANTSDPQAWEPEWMFGWKFSKGSHPGSIQKDFDDSGWETVDLPHDWAISGPFGEPADTGDTGKLPWKGQGWYRKSFTLPAASQGKRLQFVFDGVMAFSTIYLNGQEVGSWNYGYNSFWVDATQAAHFGGENMLVVHADTREHHARWYPGAGVYRKVSARLVDPVHIPVWGTYITTSKVSDESARVNVAVDVSNQASDRQKVDIEVTLLDPDQEEAGQRTSSISLEAGERKTQSLELTVSNTQRWDIEHPRLYRARVKVYVDGQLKHITKEPFGIRTFKWTADDGFHLNGRRVQLKGVNLHHDHGPLGAAFYPRAMERQLQIMRDMGVNAIRTSHNPPAPELLDMCDTMGFVVYNETFDKYGWGSGINCTTEEFVNQHAEIEVKNHLMRDRNHPSIFIWSIGNEVGSVLRDQDGKAAQHVPKMVDYFNKYDPTRPTSMGCNVPGAARKEKQILDALETTGWNYGGKYKTARRNYPDKPLIYTETASAFGTRGAYKPNLPKYKTDWGTDGELTAYILTSAKWSDIPEHEFEFVRKDDYLAGEFVWTGFDYLGEPTPYNSRLKDNPSPKDWQGRSSYFGIVDLAGLPKDSYYLYRSLWNKQEHTLHLSPHWNWKDHQGEQIPVMLYTDGDEAELFINGKSLGRRRKKDPDDLQTTTRVLPGKKTGQTTHQENPYYHVLDAYRLIWQDVSYEPGEIKAVVYKDGEKIGETTRRTAGEPDALRLIPDRDTLKANGMDLCYITIEMVDEHRVVCPRAMDDLTFNVEGAGELKGVANGNQMGLDPFTDATHPLFYGKAVAVVRSIHGKRGTCRVEVISEEGIQSAVEIVFQ